MKILAVCNKSSVLSELCPILSDLFPEAEIIQETDPLMACKYSFNNKINYVFATDVMKRMNGSDLLQFIKKEHPEVKTCLISKDIQSSSSRLFDEPDGMIGYPFSIESIKKILKIS